ncbi:MAG TPA: hypothetical protein VHM19_10115 [Polyangiales bacterium]|nr:hypothetical protein [Polyangiales bacterium]
MAALYGVLALVAGADGEIDRGEEKRFLDMLSAAAQSEEPLRSVVAAALDHAKEREAQAFASAEAALDKVRAAQTIVETRFDPEAARKWKRGLYAMGQAIAQASGGGFLGFKSRTSQTERDALVVLAACLGIDD